MTDKPFDPVTDGTPVQFWQHFANADWQDREALIQARDNAMRRKGLLEAAEIAEDIGRRWFPGEAARGACFAASNVIRAAAKEDQSA